MIINYKFIYREFIDLSIIMAVVRKTSQFLVSLNLYRFYFTSLSQT